MARVRQISDEVLALLREGSIDGNVFMLHPSRQLGGGTPLPRDLYAAFNKVMADLGGKWNRSKGGHVFVGSPGDAIADALEAGMTLVGASTKQLLGQFYTPPELAGLMVELLKSALIGRATPKVLEPSAGQGSLVEAVLAAFPAAEVGVHEIDPNNREILLKLAGKYPEQIYLRGEDFLTAKDSNRYDAVVMNPPFAKGADVTHVTKAFGMLKPGGKLVAVMSSGVEFRGDKRYVAFRELLDDVCTTRTALPESSFKEAGTAVNTILVCMQQGGGHGA